MIAWEKTLLCLLMLTVLLSAIGVVYSKHTHRQLFFKLQSLQESGDQLEVEWGQLQLEQGARSSHSEVERIARNKLDMVSPSTETVVFIKP